MRASFVLMLALATGCSAPLALGTLTAGSLVCAGIANEETHKGLMRTDADSLALSARDAYVDSEYARAFQLCHRALDRKPHHPLATRVLGAAACRLHDRARAKRVFVEVAPEFRDSIRMICHDEGIELEHSVPTQAI